MPKRFYPEARVLFEQTASGLNADILSQVEQIETKAKAAKEKGEDPRAAVADDISLLADAAHRAHQQAAENHWEAVREAQTLFERERDRHPDKELARLRRSETRITAMDQEELRSVATEYISAGGLSDEEAYTVAARLQREGLEAEFASFRDAMRERFVDRPWMRDDRVREIAQAAEAYESIEGGKVAVDGQHVWIESLVDFDSELDREV